VRNRKEKNIILNFQKGLAPFLTVKMATGEWAQHLPEWSIIEDFPNQACVSDAIGGHRWRGGLPHL
jgi:hypothetical protein